MSLNVWIVVLVAGCGTSLDNGAKAVCECTDSNVCTMTTTINSPAQCQSDADCKPGDVCTNLIADTFQCSPACNRDGSGCPVGYECQMFLP
jgi:hypothetical protein